MVLLGEKIKSLRKKYKLTQAEFGEKIGVTKSTVATYENDSRLPSYSVLVKIADVFGVSIDSMLLDKSDRLLDASGLNNEQIDIIKTLIAYFKSLEES